HLPGRRADPQRAVPLLRAGAEAHGAAGDADARLPLLRGLSDVAVRGAAGRSLLADDAAPTAWLMGDPGDALGSYGTAQQHLPRREAPILEQQHSRRLVAVVVNAAKMVGAVVAGSLGAVDRENGAADHREGAVELAEGGILRVPLHRRPIPARRL